MSLKKPKGHAIEAVFPLILFFVFSLCAITLVLLAVNIYRDTTAAAMENSGSGTAMGYLREKLRQHDAAGAVSLEEYGGGSVLVLHDTIGSQEYLSYIYVWEGSLRELFIKSGVDFKPGAGTRIMPAEGLTARLDAAGYLELCLHEASGSESRAIITLVSK